MVDEQVDTIPPEEIQYAPEPTPAYLRDNGGLSNADSSIELIGRMAVPAQIWQEYPEIASDIVLGVFNVQDEPRYEAYILHLRAICAVEDDFKKMFPDDKLALKGLRDMYFPRFYAFVEMTRGRKGHTLDALITRKIEQRTQTEAFNRMENKKNLI